MGGPSTNTMKMLEPPLIVTTEPSKDVTDEIFDQIFDSLTACLASENSPKLDEGLYMRQYAEKLRMEALAKYSE
jgi:hypothetical protein